MVGSNNHIQFEVKTHWWGLLLSLLLIAGSLTIVFGDYFLSPSEHIYGDGGDAIKNYYTPIYFIQNDTGNKFTGMWYPYGEHVVYTDNMPLFSWVMQSIAPASGWSIQQIVGVINGMMWFSIFIGAIFLFLIFRHFKIETIWVALGTTVIALLAPQFDRFTAHFGLAMMNYMPMLWFFIIKIYEQKRQWVWVSLIVIMSSVMAFIHGYYVTIGAAFLLALAFLHFVEGYWKKDYNWIHIFSLFVAATVPLLIYAGYIELTDWGENRHNNPYGYFEYRTSLKSIFLPVYGPLSQLSQYLLSYSPKNFEGYAYLGIWALPLLFWMLIAGVSSLFKKRIFTNPLSFLPAYYGYFLLAALMALLFALGIPFRLGLEDYYFKMPTGFKQFRSVGRFAWINYYVFTGLILMSAYWLFEQIKIKKSLLMANVWMVLFFGVWGFEAYHNLVPKAAFFADRKNIADFNKENFDYKAWMDEANIDLDKYQAMLYFPYFNLGSEELYISRGNASLYEACKASIHLSMPIATGYLARTCIDEAVGLAQLMSGDLIKKRALSDFNEKPLLVFTTGDYLIPQVEKVTKRGMKLSEKAGKSVFEVPLSSFKDAQKSIKDWYVNESYRFYRIDDYFTTSAVKDVVFKHFDELYYQSPKFGEGAATLRKGNLNLFLDTIPFGRKDMNYVMSLWLKIDDGSSGFPDFWYKQFDNDLNVVDEQYINPKGWMELQDGWSRIELSFTLKEAKNKVGAIMVGRKIIADELMIRPTDTHVFRRFPENDSTLVYNNYYLDINPNLKPN